MPKIILIILVSLIVLTAFKETYAQKTEGVIPHDSLMVLNEKAFSLVFNDLHQADSIANYVYNMALYQKDSTAIARATSVLGSVNWGYAKYNLSLKWYFNSLNRYEYLQDTIGIIRSYNNIAEVYKKLKYYDNSLRYLHRARKLISAYLKAETTLLNSLNIAQVFINKNKNDSARFYLNLAKKLPEKESGIRMTSFMNYLYAQVSKNEELYEESLIYIEQSIYFAKIINDEMRLADAYVLLAEIYSALNENQHAEDELKKALEIAAKYGYEHLELEVYKRLYQIALSEKDSSQAFNYLLHYSELKDGIYNTSVSRQAAEFETVYQLEKMEKENFLLQQKQDSSSDIIKYQITFITGAILALAIAIFLLLAINKQRNFLKAANTELEVKRKQVEYQKKKLEKQSKTTDALNKELTLLNKNLDSRAQEIAREMEVKNRKMNKYAFMNAHKLRAPIASILGLINLFGKDISADDGEKMIGMLKESAHKLDMVVHEIKDVIDE